MDHRHWSKETTSDFISVYKSLPCLWKVKSPEYKNRSLRHEGYCKIIDFCKSRGFPEANRDFVTKKIQSLRGCFRKEESRRRLGEISRPTLWYYDLLLFLKDHEFPADSVVNMDEPETQDQESGTGEMNTLSLKQESDTESQEYEIEETIPITTPTTTPLSSRKRSISDSHGDLPQLYAATVKDNVFTLRENRQCINEFDAIGINVSRKLEKMPPEQALHAEFLINSIIRKGLMNKLTEQTDFCDGRCRGMQTPTFLPYSSGSSASTDMHSYSESSNYNN